MDAVYKNYDGFEPVTPKQQEAYEWLTDSVVYILMLASFIIFILLLFLYAMYASFKMKRYRDVTYEEFLIGGRTVGLTVTSLSLAVTSLGGNNVQLIAASIYSSGIFWTVSLIGVPLGLLIGGLVFVRRMHKAQYVTMMEPLKEKYGDIVPAILSVLVAIFEICLAATFLSSLASGISVVMELDGNTVIFVTAIFTLLYTAYGGLYAVAYSGIIQLVLSQVLWVPAIVAYNNEAVIPNSSYTMTSFPESQDIATWIDLILLVTLGNTVSQVFYQRTLSCKSAGNSQVASVLASFAYFIIAVPVIFIGYIAVKTNWPETSMGHTPYVEHDLISLPLVLANLCPKPVAVMGMLAVAATSMAAIDAGFLSAASLLVHHVYLPLRRFRCFNNEPSDVEKVWIARGLVLVVALISSALSVSVASLFGIVYLLSDFYYVILFPQLICALFIPLSNVWGSFAGIFFGLLFRILAGEPLTYMPAVIKYLGFDVQNYSQRFPHRTFIMILSFVIIILVSFVSQKLIFRRAQPEMAADDKKAAWFGSEGGYKKKSPDGGSEIDLSDKSDTQL